MLDLKIAYVGVDVPGFDCYEPTIYGIHEALRKGARHLKIPEGFGWVSDLSLAEYGNGFLCIEGGGGHNLGNAERAFSGGPMIHWPKGYRWGIYCVGFSIDARGDLYKDERDNTWDIGEMYFGVWDRCMAWRAGGTHFNFHDEIQCVTFRDTIASDSGGFGYRIKRGTNIHWVGGAGACERNREGGILWEADPDQSYTGTGTIRQHFEQNGGPAIDLRRIHAVSVKNSFSYLSDFVWDENCRNLEIKHNELVSYGLDPDGFPNTRLIGPRAGHDIGFNTYVDYQSGLLHPDPDAEVRLPWFMWRPW